ncbi:pentapeptide repeat-containing protein [Salibaculum griseiflavum]|uniref:Pentapeptide repeat-containing protein n=1 Tax=Salibaculum griseiflavum TaxID=1914409 RepID=A0A2V1P221_9RHOB|nr:hypothetical protein [Salibaculum griseiflavum]PWG15894.1 hypothetical protein DFK10_14680 [Salibaculum griseiflavum]
MLNNIEEILSEEEKISLLRIQKAVNWSFSNLVKISGLDPKLDFQNLDLRELDLRGEDLRGFNFRGSDLRGSVRDDSTLIDKTTILADTQIDWIESDNPDITELMSKIQSASSKTQKQELVAELCDNYNSPDHIRQFLRGQIERTASVENFVVLVDRFEPKHTNDKIAILRSLRKLALQSAKKRRAKGKSQFSVIGFSSFIKQLESSRNNAVLTVLENYVGQSYKAGRVSLDPKVFEISDDLTRFLEAVETSDKSSIQQLL